MELFVLTFSCLAAAQLPALVWCRPQAIPVDMFPHTPHMELVMVFERIEYEAEEPIPSVAGHYQPSPADAAPAAATGAAEVVDAAKSDAPQAIESETTPALAPEVATTAAKA